MLGLNLRQNIVVDYWKQRDARMQVILEWMESLEEWRLDEDQDFNKALLELEPRLDHATHAGLYDNTEKMLDVMAYMSPSRAMRLLEWMDETYDKSLSVHYVQQAQEQADNPNNQLMLDRLRALQSLQLLGKVFRPARAMLITRLLEQESQELDGNSSY